MNSKVSKILEGLPKPPKENLTSHFILGEIIDHIGALQDEFPHVQIDRFKEHLWAIRNKNVEPEKHLRGFLKVFEHTNTFKDAFGQLDDGTKRQLRSFMAGGSEDSVMASGASDGEFHLPPSPPVRHHFREIVERVEEKIQELFGGDSKQLNGLNGVEKVEVEKTIASQGFPRIYEDRAETRTMEVRNAIFILFAVFKYEHALYVMLAVFEVIT